MGRLQALAAQFEIRDDWVRRLRRLEGYTVVLVCDDSGSMATAVDPPPGANPYAPRATRWDELRNTAGMLCELAATCSSTAAVDVYFLNRPPMKAATGSAQLQAAFNFAPPQGFTPLARVFRQVLAEHAAALTERKLLVIIATDGRPTTDAGNDDVPGFVQALRSMPRTCFVQIMACTDDENDVAYLNEVDDTVERVDVTDDYRSEKKEVLAAQGPGFRFSYGDYVVKALLGPIDADFDALDEKRRAAPAGAGGLCCAVC